MLATRLGRCIRFQITDDTLRVFAGRDSSGVRGIRLGQGDEVNSLAVLNHVEADVSERAGYMRMAIAKRRTETTTADTEAAVAEIEAEATDSDGEESAAAAILSPERFAELEGSEEILLTVTNGGFGKRSSAYDYRVSGRGGLGIANVSLSPRRNGSAVVATLPVLHGTDVMLVTDAGRLIRVPVDQVRITARQSMGVTLFRLGGAEHVTSVFPVLEGEVPDADEVPADSLPVTVADPDAAALEPTPLAPILGDPFEAGPADPGPSDLQEDPDA